MKHVPRLAAVEAGLVAVEAEALAAAVVAVVLAVVVAVGEEAAIAAAVVEAVADTKIRNAKRRRLQACVLLFMLRVEPTQTPLAACAE